MRNLLIVMIIIVMFISCSRDWDNPLETDEELATTPKILEIAINANHDIELTLEQNYSPDCDIILERKTPDEEFSQIEEFYRDNYTVIDVSYDKELDHNFIYRIQVQKSDYFSEYSEEVSINYDGDMIYAPASFEMVSLEFEGVQLSWQDKSQKEDGYVIQRNIEDGNYAELALLDANATSYKDTDYPDSVNISLDVSYRIRAFSDNLSSDWIEDSSTYTGIKAPTNLAITDSDYYEFTLEWDDNSDIEVAYVIHNNGSFFAELPENSTSFTKTLSDTGEYYFTVKAKVTKNSQIYHSVPTNAVYYHLPSFVPDEGLTAHYPFDGSLSDYSGNEFHGELSSGYEVYGTDRLGVANKAIELNGSKYIETIAYAAHLDIDGDKPKSISIWVRTSSFDRGGAFDVGKEEAKKQFCLRTLDPIIDLVGEDNHWRMQFWQDDENFEYDSKDKWVHFVMLYDGTTAKTYADGELEQTHAIDLDTSNANPFRIGAYKNNYFSGLIDDVRVYNRALTETEIKQLYHERGYGE
jgi:hypothetical protein